MSGNSPYVGPRPFARGDTLFGRDRECRELLDLLVAERIVVLHSPSGAGKTSLVEAGLVPELKQARFDVWPAIRVNSPLPTSLASKDQCEGEGLTVNRYALSVMLSLEEELPEEKKRPHDELARLSLERYLETRPKRKKAPPSSVLLFDQFEEILTTDPLAVEAKQEFFRQLGAALQNPGFWALFVLREDYLAAFEPYTHHLPSHFANTYRLDLLQRKAATQAIAEPARGRGREFSDAALQRLLDDLATQSVQQADGRFQTVVGRYIEPVQLQVVCGRLWRELPEACTEIGPQHLQQAGDVNQALADYYRAQVETISNPDNERQIREWFSEKLISPQGIRIQVLKGEGFSDGLDNTLISLFVDSYLLRSEKRGGKTWFELAHDRLVDPVRQSNANWFEANLHPMQRQAALWEKQGRSDSLLLRGKDLDMAKSWAAKFEAKKLLPLERELLQRSLKQRQGERVKRWGLVGGLVAAVLFMVSLGFLFLEAQKQTVIAEQQKQEAQKQEELAQKSLVKAASQQQRALLNQSRFLADKARQLNEQNKPFSAMRVALEALPETSETHPERPLLREAIRQLSYASDRHWHGILEHEDPVRAAIYSPDGSRILSWTENQVILWDAKTGGQIRAFRGHTDEVWQARFSPDGQRIITTSQDKTARLWDAKSGEGIRVFRGHNSDVVRAAFSPDGRRIVTASLDGTARMWDTESDDAIQVFQSDEHYRSVMRVAFSPDGQRIVTSYMYNAPVLLWDAETGEVIRGFQGHNDTVTNATFSFDGKRIIIASSDRTAQLWNGDTGEVIQVFQGHTGRVWQAIFSPDERSIITTSDDKTARLWDVETGEVIKVLQGHTDRVRDAAFSPDGRWILTASQDKTARLWDAETGDVIRVFQGHESSVNSVAFSLDGRHIITASSDKTVRLWNTKTGEPIRFIQVHEGAVSHVAFSPNGRRIVTSSRDNNARLWDAMTGEAIQVFLGHTGDVSQANFSPDGQLIVTASSDGTARLWDAETGYAIGSILDHASEVSYAVFSPDGRRILTLADGFTVRLWGAEAGNLLSSLFGYEDFVTHAAFSPDGRRILTASEYGVARLWDVETSEAIQVFQGHDDSVTYATFSPGGRRIVTASKDKTARVWDAETGETIRALQGHCKDFEVVNGGNTCSVTYATFSPDGHRIVTASDDKSVRLWDAKTGDVVRVIRGHEGGINHVAFSPDGRRIVTASDDESARLWDAETGDVIRVFRGHQGAVNHAAFSPDGRRIVTVSRKNVRLWLALPDNELAAYSKKMLVRQRLLCEEREKEYFLDFLERCGYIEDKNIRGDNYSGGVNEGGQAHGDGKSAGRNLYEGGFINGMKHGQGTYIWADGTVYTGEFADDEAVGIGPVKADADDWYWEAIRAEEPGKVMALLETQLRVLPGHVPSLLHWGDLLAKLGELERAAEKFRQAKKLDPALDLEPEARARKKRASEMVWNAGLDAKKGEINAALETIAQARKLYAEVEIWAMTWGYICRGGTLHRQARKVLDACEQAVVQASQREEAEYRESRGLARAITGDFDGALEDFRFIEKNPKSWLLSSKQQRTAWIEALEHGENPFTENVLESLR